MATLTNSEEQRLQKVEATTTQVAHLVKGTGSKNQLNRLLTLCQEQIRDLDGKVTDLETEVTTLLRLTRKLQ